MEIRNFEELIKPALKSGQKFVSYECKKLLSAGENYGSVMLQVQVKVLGENDVEEILHCVAKACPPAGILWEIFNTKSTFKKEIAVYSTIVPELNEFGRENGVDCLMDFIAECLGARISLDSESNVVDENAILLLENLKIKGYDVGDRFSGFDMESSKLLLSDLAKMHAAPIAYKLRKPEAFKTKILPYLSKNKPFRFEEDISRALIKVMQEAVAPNPKCVPYLSKIEDAMSNMSKIHETQVKGKEKFTTLTHNDYWVNNTMLTHHNGKPTKNKILDFQIIEYASLAHDVIFFLYTSVELAVLENNLDELLKYYYEKFMETLVKLQCDVTSFTFHDMMEEFALIAKKAQFAHIMFMLGPILTLKGKAAELSDLKPSDVIPTQVKFTKIITRECNSFCLIFLTENGYKFS